MPMMPLCGCVKAISSILLSSPLLHHWGLKQCGQIENLPVKETHVFPLPELLRQTQLAAEKTQ